ncbi:MAG TPA: VanZ family protein [bacterium]|nr:VanZ family protein [bacterium]
MVRVRSHRNLIAWIPAAVWMAGMAWVSLLPGPPLTPGTDLWLHALAYGILTVLLRFATASRGTVQSALLAAGAAIAYGMFLEGVQAVLPYRTAEARDLLANAIGVAAAVLIPIRRR